MVITTKCSNNRLITTVGVVNKENDLSYRVNAIWDTGAPFSVLDRDIIDKLNLPFISYMTIGGIEATPKEVGQYSTYLLLHSNTELLPIVVTEFKQITKDNIQMIIGMDIIKLGIFTIKPVDKNVVMTWEFIPEETNNLNNKNE